MSDNDLKQESRKAAQAAKAGGQTSKSDRRSEAMAQDQAQEKKADKQQVKALVEQLQARIKELTDKVAELDDQLLRKAAEFENFRKRMFREREEGIKYANTALLSDVLPIIDDFERAIQSAGESRDFDAFHTGVSMIEKQLVSILERNWGLKRFSAGGELFDPEKHEAIAVQETGGNDPPVVVEEYQKGYLLHDRVLRPAKVKVAKPVSPQEAGGSDSSQQEGVTDGQDNRN